MKYSEDTPGDILCFETDHKKSIWYQTHDSMWHFQDKLIWMNRHREEQDGRKKRLCGTPFCGSEWLELYGKWLCKRLFFDGVYQTGDPGGKRNSIWLEPENEELLKQMKKKKLRMLFVRKERVLSQKTERSDDLYGLAKIMEFTAEKCLDPKAFTRKEERVWKRMLGKCYSSGKNAIKVLKNWFSGKGNGKTEG